MHHYAGLRPRLHVTLEAKRRMESNESSIGKDTRICVYITLEDPRGPALRNEHEPSPQRRVGRSISQRAGALDLLRRTARWHVAFASLTRPFSESSQKGSLSRGSLRPGASHASAPGLLVLRSDGSFACRDADRRCELSAMDRRDSGASPLTGPIPRLAARDDARRPATSPAPLAARVPWLGTFSARDLALVSPRPS
jgi:hypothetical protein